MKMFLTRMGVNSRAVITGDVTQIDLRNPDDSGLVRIQGILNGVPDIKFLYFHAEDVVRHRLVRDIIRAFDQYHTRMDGKSDDGVGASLDPESMGSEGMNGHGTIEARPPRIGAPQTDPSERGPSI
jgi:hypothetical protein